MVRRDPIPRYADPDPEPPRGQRGHDPEGGHPVTPRVPASLPRCQNLNDKRNKRNLTHYIIEMKNPSAVQC